MPSGAKVLYSSMMKSIEHLINFDNEIRAKIAMTFDDGLNCQAGKVQDNYDKLYI